MTDAQRRLVVQAVVKASRGRLPIAVQATDNSAPRMREAIRIVQADGADVAVLAAPYFALNASPSNLIAMYREVIRGSPLPIGFYDRGNRGAVPLSHAVVDAIVREPKVVMVKDSSGDPERRALFLDIRRQRPGLLLLNGDEFRCEEYLKAGYDGLLLGGAAFNGALAGAILAAARRGEWTRAARLQKRMNRMMWTVYGGRSISCWLAGEKRLLMELGVFRSTVNLLRYILPPRRERAIVALAKRECAVLLPRQPLGASE